MAALCGDVFISKLLKFRLSFAIFQYSNPSFPYISHHPLQIFHTCKKIRGRADHRFIFELSSSQEQSIKVRKGKFATQDLTEAVQQNEESFPRSLNNATLSNWVSVLSNLGYFCEVRSIIVVKFTMPFVALIIEQSRVRSLFTRTFLGTAASRGIFKIFTP